MQGAVQGSPVSPSIQRHGPPLEPFFPILLWFDDKKMNQSLKLVPMARAQFGTPCAAGIQRIQAIKLSRASGPAELVGL